jgi:hypothetical protein
MHRASVPITQRWRPHTCAHMQQVRNWINKLDDDGLTGVFCLQTSCPLYLPAIKHGYGPKLRMKPNRTIL